MLPLEGATVPAHRGAELVCLSLGCDLFEALLRHRGEDFAVMVSALYAGSTLAAVNFCALARRAARLVSGLQRRFGSLFAGHVAMVRAVCVCRARAFAGSTWAKAPKNSNRDS